MSKVVLTLKSLKSQVQLESQLELSKSDRYEITQDLINLLKGAMAGAETLIIDATYADAAASEVDQGITYVAKDAGTQGNDITIDLVDPSANDAPLTITVVGLAITVLLATDGAGVLTTTADELVAALKANQSASALVTVSGTGVVALAEASVQLVGGTDQTKSLKFNMA